MKDTMKTPGQIAYEKDCQQQPIYPHNGERRRSWCEISQIARDSWERKPKPRFGAPGVIRFL